MRKDSIENQQGDTYARRNQKKKAKFQTDDQDTYKLVDDFVQDVIERAKSEYLRQCSNHQGDHDVTSENPCREDNRRDQDGESRGLLKDNKDTDAGGKAKRKHNYKYSDPVDEKEISVYEKQEADSLLATDPTLGHQPQARRLPLYERTVSRFRSLIGCCLGKT